MLACIPWHTSRSASSSTPCDEELIGCHSQGTMTKNIACREIECGFLNHYPIVVLILECLVENTCIYVI